MIRRQVSFGDVGIHNLQREMMLHVSDTPVRVPRLNMRLKSDVRLLLRLS